MSRSPSSPLALLPLALALAAGCTTRDVETHPFHLSVTVPDGSSLAGRFDAPTIVRLTGTAHVASPSSLVLLGAVLQGGSAGDVTLGDVTFAFDPHVASDVAFPARLEGTALTADVGLAPAGRGPAGEPMPVTGYRFATGQAGLSYEFMIGEGTAQASGGLARIPAPLFLITLQEDIPALGIHSDELEYEPARCGLVYLDALLVSGPASGSGPAVLRRGAEHLVAVGDRPDPWIVLHVLSWHRQGACPGQPSVWTQIAAWR